MHRTLVNQGKDPKELKSQFTFDPVPGGQFVENDVAIWGNVYNVNASVEIELFGHLECKEQ